MPLILYFNETSLSHYLPYKLSYILLCCFHFQFWCVQTIMLVIWCILMTPSVCHLICIAPWVFLASSILVFFCAWVYYICFTSCQFPCIMSNKFEKSYSVPCVIDYALSSLVVEIFLNVYYSHHLICVTISFSIEVFFNGSAILFMHRLPTTWMLATKVDSLFHLSISYLFVFTSLEIF